MKKIVLIVLMIIVFCTVGFKPPVEYYEDQSMWVTITTPYLVTIQPDTEFIVKTDVKILDAQIMNSTCNAVIEAKKGQISVKYRNDKTLGIMNVDYTPMYLMCSRVLVKVNTKDIFRLYSDIKNEYKNTTLSGSELDCRTLEAIIQEPLSGSILKSSKLLTSNSLKSILQELQILNDEASKLLYSINTSYLQQNPDIEKQVETILSNAKTDTEKIKAIQEWVDKNVEVISEPEVLPSEKFEECNIANALKNKKASPRSKAYVVKFMLNINDIDNLITPYMYKGSIVLVNEAYDKAKKEQVVLTHIPKEDLKPIEKFYY